MSSAKVRQKELKFRGHFGSGVHDCIIILFSFKQCLIFQFRTFFQDTFTPAEVDIIGGDIE
jgi:hypothetical protein